MGTCVTVADESDLGLKWFSFSRVTSLFPSVVSLLVCFISFFFLSFSFPLFLCPYQGYPHFQLSYVRIIST